MGKIRVLVVKPNKEPVQMKVEHTLENLQNVVGGLIEYVELDHNTDIICNEEGKLINLELNRRLGNDIIAGTFIIAGQHYGDTISLSRKQTKKYKQMFRLSNHKEVGYLKERLLNNNCIIF